MSSATGSESLLTSSAEKLYDRGMEQAALLEAFNRASQSATKDLTLVTGESGSGKTALVSTLSPIVVSRGGYFMRGKFDRTAVRDYSAIVEAFASLTDQLIERRDQNVLSRVKRVVSTKEPLLRLIPALTRICAQETPVKSPATGFYDSNMHRQLQFDFCRFINAVCSPSRPIVMFLDDLQWGDKSSLELLAALVQDQSTKGLMIVGACRGNEVALDHCLSATLRELEANEVKINDFELLPLDETIIAEIISDKLEMDPASEHTWMLASAVYEETAGNPFFVTQLLLTLADNGTTSVVSDATGGGAVSLITRRLKTLDKSTQKILCCASCFGIVFEKELLLNMFDEHTLQRALEEATENGVLCQDESPDCWKFVHDQVQESAYSMIPPNERENYHLYVGRTLWSAAVFNGRDVIEMESLFIIVTQLTKGARLITDDDERERMAELLLIAATKAAKASMFAAAASQLDLGISMLGPRHWRDQYRLSLGLFNAAAEMHYCTADFSRMDELIYEVQVHARSVEDKVQALNTRIYSLGSRGDLKSALDVGVSLLRELGEHLPKKPGIVAIFRDFLKTKQLLNKLSDDEILAFPNLDDPKKIAAMKVLIFIFPYALTTRSKLTPVLTIRLVRISLQNGMSGLASVGFAYFGLLLCNGFGAGEIPLGVRLGRLAITTMERFGAHEWMPRVIIAANTFCFTFVESLRAQLKPLQLAHRHGLSGDVEMSLQASVVFVSLAFVCSLELRKTIKEGEIFIRLAELHRQENHLDFLRPYQQVFINLLEDVKDPAILSGTYLNEDEAFAEALANNKRSVASLIQMLKLFLATYTERQDRALAASEFLENNMGDDFAAFAAAQVYLHAGMACFRASKHVWDGCARKAHRHLRKLRALSKISPQNYAGKLLLLEGERLFCAGKASSALGFYVRAAELCRRENFWSEAGLACERAAAAYNKIGRAHDATTYQELAISAYRVWGATSIVRRLRKIVPVATLSVEQATQAIQDGYSRATSSSFTGVSDHSSFVI